MMDRAERLARLGRDRFDLLVVGGGIVGAGLARDATLRGLRVALIEQGDFASGTSSKTSKLIHGGLRYLEQGRVALVRESLRERAVLRRIAPTLVEPRTLLLPIFEGDRRGRWTIRAGLALYGLLARGDPLPSPRMIGAEAAGALEPWLVRQGLRAAGRYADCLMDDVRLCLANVLDAARGGAVCANYVRVVGWLRARGRLCGAAAQDRLGGGTLEVRAEAVVNATGPWADRLRRLSDPAAPRRLAPTKGIHLVLARPIRHAIFAQARADGRMVFLLPWQGGTLVGTTESPVTDSLEALRATREEVDYLLAAVNQVLPGMRAGGADVVATFAGARPLVAFSGSAYRASREHRIEVDRWGLVSVYGGKYTTYRRMTEQALDVVLRRMHRGAGRCETGVRPLWTAWDRAEAGGAAEAARRMGPERLHHLAARYGQAAPQLLRLVAEDPTLAEPVCVHQATLAVEIAHALRHELACSLTDALVRRTPFAWSRCHGLDALPALTRVAERYGDGRAPVDRQVEDYRQVVADGLAFRTRETARDTA